MGRLSGAVAVWITVVSLCLAACGNGANDVAACQELESARCARAPSCGVDLTWPLHEGSSMSDNVTACQLYYQDACLHGLVTTVSSSSRSGPTASNVSSCVAAIQHGPCTVLLAPESSPACSFLIPPDAGVDAGLDAGSTDATADVVVVPPIQDTGVDTADVSSCDPTCEANCVSDPNCIMACGC